MTDPIKQKIIEVGCDHCGKKYPVIRRGKRELQDILLNFAICTYCKTPRFPKNFDGRKKDDLCLLCNVPKKYFDYCGGARGLCGRSYVIQRLAGTRHKFRCRSKAMSKKYD